MKSLFSTPKKVIILVICAVVVIVAASVITVKSTLITKAEATTVALRDAGLSEAEASALRTRLEFDDGRFQYEVDFYNNGTEYEYLIQAKNGDIIARDIDGGRNSNNDVQDLPQDTGNQFASDENSSMQPQESVENQPDKEGIALYSHRKFPLMGRKQQRLRMQACLNQMSHLKRQNLIMTMERRYMTLNFILPIQNTNMKLMLPAERCLKRILSNFRYRRIQQTVP